MAPKSSNAWTGGWTDDWTIEIETGQEFEECLEFQWALTHKSVVDASAPKIKNSTIQMVIDRSDPKTTPTEPPKDAMIKRVEFGKETKASLQNMPEGRRYLISVLAECNDESKLQSPWVRVKTLDPRTRDEHLGNLDPMDKPRLNCKCCPCMGYIAVKWSQFSGGSKLRCRRCGCPYDMHVAVEISDILHAREVKAKERMRLTDIPSLPREAIEWDERECDLWFLTEGDFHPRTSHGHFREPPPSDKKFGPGGPHGIAGKKGRVSVVTPTTESRHKFLENLWKCFVSQEWPDKELVVVETYVNEYSKFLESIARQDERLIFVKYQRPAGDDWSIGLKRNIGAHLASGEYIANFDDDDIYAQTYLTTMIGQLEIRKAQALTLSSWFIYDVARGKWSYCDSIAWGLAQGLDESAQEVQSWAFGYGFSYLNRRRIALEVPYDDRNMGEDFVFIRKLQAHKNDKSVQLYHDAFGICVHIQHGANTSNTFPIREVSPEEVIALDVAELARMVDGNLPHRPARRLRLKNIVCHMQEGQYTIQCEPGPTVEQVLEKLREERGKSCEDLKVHIVPPPRHANRQRREDIAAEVLGVVPLMEKLAETKPDLNLEYVANRRRDLMLQRVKLAMRKTDRVPLTIRELWLAEPGEAEAEAADVKALDLAGVLKTEEKKEEIKMNIIEVAIRATSAKAFLNEKRSFQVMLPEKADVGMLRYVVGPDLPSTARFFADGEEREYQLQEKEQVPPKITTTEFKGKRAFYTYFTKEQCAANLKMLKAFFVRADTQQKLNKMERECTSDTSWRIGLSTLLMTEAYPAMFRHYGAELEGVESVWCVLAAMREVSGDLELLEQQFEVECLMRNKASAHIALNQIKTMREEQGMPPFSLNPLTAKWLDPANPANAKQDLKAQADTKKVVEISSSKRTLDGLELCCAIGTRKFTLNLGGDATVSTLKRSITEKLPQPLANFRVLFSGNPIFEGNRSIPPGEVLLADLMGR